MVLASQREALLAVDLYNRTASQRSLEGFYVHMHIAWLYLLHAEFRREGKEYVYRLPDGRVQLVDGEPKTWELQRCIEERWDPDDPVRRNLELSVALRNKVEHRYAGPMTVATSGYVQALLLNYEDELRTAFGSRFSLGDGLRFPLYVGTFTREGVERIVAAQRAVPARLRRFLADFHADLDPSVREDQRYEFRVHLIPRTGPRNDSDVAMTFVREEELTVEQRQALIALGDAGTVVVRERQRPVANLGLLRPAQAARAIEARLQFRFGLYSHFPAAWRRLGVRPEGGSPHPERTDERYCIFDRAHGDYLYTSAFVDRVVREVDTAEKWQAFFGRPPRLKAQTTGSYALTEGAPAISCGRDPRSPLTRLES